MFIGVSIDVPNPANCASHISGSKRTVAAVPAHNNVDHVLSLALASKLANAPVDVQIYDDRCYEGWPVMRRIRLK